MNLKEKLACEYSVSQYVEKIKKGMAVGDYDPSVSAFLAGFAKALELAAHKALNYGYTLDYDRNHQPWASEANHWLRAQNKEIEKQIKALGEEEVH